MRFFSSRIILTLALLCTSFLFTPPRAFASVTFTNQTTGMSASGQSWQSITSSSDGTKLAAGTFGGDIWTSTDSGATWTNQTTGTSASNKFWFGITSSSDGTKLAVGDDSPGDIWTSTDSGLTWTDRTTGTSASDQAWQSITSSSDGTKLASVAETFFGPGDIWTSTDSGLTWTNRTTGTSGHNKNWASITSSADGTKLAAGSLGGDIWTSTDSGLTWTNRTTGTSAHNKYWYSITSSSDGTKLAAGDDSPGDIWTSTDSGLTWTDRTTGTSASGQDWVSITSSSDGTKLAAGSLDGDIWTSSDSGITWTNQTAGTSAHNKFWYSITSSSDGTKLAAGDEGSGDIWTALVIVAPTLTTSAASSIITTGATLNGTITATGGENPATRGFVYGVTTAYGATTTESGSFSAGSFTATLSSLTCNTAYHFASYATNSVAISYGSDTTFTTSACPVAAPPPPAENGPIFSGPASALPGYVASRPQIDYPDGHVVYLDATSSTTTIAVSASTTTPSLPRTTPASSTQPQPAPISTPPRPFAFTQNEQLRDQGPDILALQEFLNAHSFPVSATGPGSPGEETDFFGVKTYQALVKFQAANDLPPTGYFGPLTRAAIDRY